MPSALDKNLRSGDRSEYLAQYILSAMGVSVLVPRPEDYGIDCSCALQREEGRRLTFHSPFNVQVGSIDGDVSHKQFVYGGLTKNEDPSKRAHRAWEIEFLRRQQLPFFAGTVDKKQHRLRLYSTSPMWYVLHRFAEVGEITLCPEAAHDIDKQTDPLALPDGRSLPRFLVPLGPPVLDVTVMDLWNDSLDKAVEALANAIHIEQRNLLYRDLDVQYFLRLANYTPNQVTNQQYYSFVPHQAVLQKTPDWLRPVIIMMAMAYEMDGNAEAIEKIRGMLTLLPLSQEDKKILAQNAGITDL